MSLLFPAAAAAAAAAKKKSFHHHLRRRRRWTPTILPPPLRLLLLLQLVMTTTLLFNSGTRRTTLVVTAVRILPSERHNNNNNNNTSSNNYSRRSAAAAARATAASNKITTQVHVDVPTSPDAHLVTDLPLLAPGTFATQHWAGHLPASGNGDKYFFYWLFAPDFTNVTTSSTSKTAAAIDDAKVPLIVWLNGGPACSSMDGLFIENGPFRLSNEGNNFKITAALYSWHKAPAYTLYIDQPVGTGLSFTTSAKYPTNDKEVNTDFYYFLQQFFTLHSDKFVTNTPADVTSSNTKTNKRRTMHRKLYFSGESYAGHYIPSLMNYLLKKNDADAAADADSSSTTTTTNNDIAIPVAGGAIGNGWTDPFYQYSGTEFAYGHGLIGLAEMAALEVKEKECQAQLNLGRYSVGTCFDLIDDILAASHGSTSNSKASGYDVRISESKHGARTFPPGHQVVESYLGGWPLPATEAGRMPAGTTDLVLQALHATAAAAAGQTYRECTDPPYNALSGNDGKGVVDDVVAILQHAADNNNAAVQLLFFNGIHDIVCNHVGNERYLERLPWEHAADWVKAERYAWVAATEEPGRVSGYMKEYQNLKFLKILEAGHMVPMDVPGVALDMMKLFTYSGSFDTSKQNLPTGGSGKDEATCPICPTCLERDSAVPDPPPNKQDDVAASAANSGDNSKMGTFVISYAWLVAGVGLAAFCLLVSVVRKRGSASAVHRAAIVPQYELELREGNGKNSSTYRDDFSDASSNHNGDAPENGGGVI